MKYEFKSSFERDLKKAPVFLKIGVLEIVENIKNANNLNEIEGIKKMVGSKNAYRVRTKNIKDFRIGFKLVDEIIILSRLLARKEIYKNFP